MGLNIDIQVLPGMFAFALRVSSCTLVSDFAINACIHWEEDGKFGSNPMYMCILVLLFSSPFFFFLLFVFALSLCNFDVLSSSTSLCVLILLLLLFLSMVLACTFLFSALIHSFYRPGHSGENMKRE